LFQQDVIDWFAFLNVVFSVLSVMAFAVAGAMHLSGKVFQYNFAMLLLMPSIWAVVNLFKIFAGLNTIAVATVDTSSLFFFMFFAVFAYWQAMVLNNMTSKSAIKSCFAYGLSLSALGISLAVRKITEICINGTIFSTPEDNMIIILSVLASGYAIAQLVTYTKRCRTMLEDKHLYEAQEEQEAAEADEDESDFKFPFSQTNTSRIPVIVPDATPREVPDILSYDDEPSSENMPDINTINSNLIGATDEFEIPAEAAAEKEPALEQPLKTAAETPEEAKKPEEPTQPEPLPEEEIKIENYDEEDADTLAAIDKLIEQLQ
ncbi:MAG: hypothetical protein LBM65_00390, partial [Oscillospiraceae bacterium]|nr:hypothetical protein [Oscillospiraceae bacterium]